MEVLGRPQRQTRIRDGLLRGHYVRFCNASLISIEHRVWCCLDVLGAVLGPGLVFRCTWGRVGAVLSSIIDSIEHHHLWHCFGGPLGDVGALFALCTNFHRALKGPLCTIFDAS